MGVNIVGEKSAPVNVAALKRAGAAALRSVLRKNSELTVVFADDRKMSLLNSAYRGQRRATDILSFASGDARDLGDIFISLRQARKKAAARGMELADYLILLVVHGTLHLNGFDHEKPADAKQMEKKEKAIMRKLNVKLE